MSNDMYIISKKIDSINNLKTASFYIGKKAFSKSGNPLGRIKDVVLSNDHIMGITISGNPDIFIDKEYLDYDSRDVIMLTIEPVTSVIGKLVFDKSGKKLGKVISIERKNSENILKSLKVRNKIYSKPFMIDQKEISVIKDNIMLKKIYDK